MYLGGPKLTYADSPQVLPSSGLQPTMADRGLGDHPMSRTGSMVMSDRAPNLGSLSGRYETGLYQAASNEYKALSTCVTRPAEVSGGDAVHRRASNRGARAGRRTARVVPG